MAAAVIFIHGHPWLSETSVNEQMCCRDESCEAGLIPFFVSLRGYQ